MSLKEITLTIIYAFCRLQKELEILEKFLEDEKDLQETKEYEAASLVAKEAKEVLTKTP